MKVMNTTGVLLSMLALSTPLSAQDAPAQHDMQNMQMEGHGDGASKAHMDGMKQMSRDMSAEMTGDADIDFALMMIPHHQGAIDMAKVELQYGKAPGLRKLAEAIVAAQESEIAFLKGWLAKNGTGERPSAAHAQHMPAGMAYMEGMKTMDQRMNAEMSGDADRDFAVMMIPHHQGAIDMAKVQIEYGKDPELRKVSEGVIAAQESEIETLKTWLARQ
jgi:uncharacterized protein (DUF305 family)